MLRVVASVAFFSTGHGHVVLAPMVYSLLPKNLTFQNLLMSYLIVLSLNRKLLKFPEEASK